MALSLVSVRNYVAMLNHQGATLQNLLIMKGWRIPTPKVTGKVLIIICIVISETNGLGTFRITARVSAQVLPRFVSHLCPQSLL